MALGTHGEHQGFAAEVHDESSIRRGKGRNGLHGTRLTNVAGGRTIRIQYHRVAVDVAVLDDDVATHGNHVGVRLEFGQHGIPEVVGAEDEDDLVAGDAPADRRHGVGCRGAAKEEFDPFLEDRQLPRQAGVVLDVDGDHASGWVYLAQNHRPQHVAASHVCAGLDHEVRFHVEADLLRDPNVVLPAEPQPLTHEDLGRTSILATRRRAAGPKHTMRRERSRCYDAPDVVSHGPNNPS